MTRTGIDNIPAAQKVLWLIFKAYLRVCHGFETHFPEGSPPPRGPFLALTSHFSILDVLALIAADPDHPHTTVAMKDSVMRFPVVRHVLRAWGAVSVKRDGHDLGAIRDILHILHQGRGIAIAAQGTRSRTGHLGPMDPVLMRLAVQAASEGIPVIPIVETGTYEAMPAGAWVPRPHKIRVIAGDPIDLSPWVGRKVDEARLAEVAALIQSKIAALLPPERRPAPDTPALGPLRVMPNGRRHRQKTSVVVRKVKLP